MPESDRSAMSVVLFDIDGTLLSLHGAGRRAFRAALTAVFGWDEDLDDVNFWGATDLDVLDQIARRHRHSPSPDEVRRFFQRMPIELKRRIPEAEATVHPGVIPLVERLAENPSIVLGLVTGNIAACARIKLERFGLHGHFVLGAFGHEHADRREIARLALARAERALPSGRTLAGRFLIGDTPSDIDAARAIGAVSLAVATGTYGTEALAEAGADHVLRDLSDRDLVLGLLGLEPRGL